MMENKKNIAIEEMLKDYKWNDCYVWNILEYCRSHSENFCNEYNWYIQIFEHNFDLIKYSIDLINFIDKSNWKEYHLHQYILLSNSLCFLFNSFDSEVRGQHTISNLTLRSYFETLIKVFYISWNKNCFSWIYWSWYRKKWDKWFNLTDFIKNNLENDWLKIYNFLSKESHWNINKTIDDIKKFSEWKKVITFELDTKEITKKFHQNILIMCLYITLKYLYEILLNEYKINSEEIKKKNLEFEFDKKVNSALLWLSKLLWDIDKEKYDDLWKESDEVISKIKIQEDIN